MNQPPTQNIAPEHHLDGASLTVGEAARGATFDDLLKHLTEGLNVEVKTWISADEPNGIAKIVRGVFALRNRNGGFFIIGFDDKTLQPDITNRPSDLKGAFHFDKIQGLISRYSSELFEIGVAFPQLDGH
jgi:hypothetical protein